MSTEGAAGLGEGEPGDVATLPGTASGEGQPARRSALGRLRASPIPLALTAIALLVLTWPVGENLLQTPMLDRAWMIGLQQAAEGRLGFGTDIVFTYGPLGFLAWPTPFLGTTSVLAFGATVAVYLGLVAALVVAAHRRLPLLGAAALVLLFARGLLLVEPFEALELLAFAAAVELLRRTEVEHQDAVALAAGVLAGVAILGKLSVGVFIGAMAVLVVLAIARRPIRGMALLVGAAAVTGLVGWLATGQRLGDVPAYAAGSLQIISGYSDAMQPSVSSLRSVDFVMFVLVAAVTAWVAWRVSAGWTRGHRLALAAIVMLLVVAMWKSHPAPAITILALAVFVLVLPSTSRLITLVVVLATVGVATLVVSPRRPAQYAAVPTSVTNFAAQAGTVLRPWRWAPATAETRAVLRTQFAVPPGLVALLDDRTVHIDPWYADVATAYPAMRWQPMPVFQTYSAYTPYLDDLNAASLRADSRPERILRHATDEGRGRPRTNDWGIRHRFYWYESPAASVERLCRYRELAVSEEWQVLGATNEACGPERPLGAVTAAWGTPVAVPPAPNPDDMVVVRVTGVNEGILPRLRSTLWRGATWYVRLDGIRYTLVPGTASQPLVLSVPSSAQGSAPFAFGPSIGHIAAYPAGRSAGGGELTYTFSAMAVP